MIFELNTHIVWARNVLKKGRRFAIQKKEKVTRRFRMRRVPGSFFFVTEKSRLVCKKKSALPP